MRIMFDVPKELERIINFINKRQGDCESLRTRFRWHGHKITCLPLSCSYGVIGYSVQYRGSTIQVDNELNRIILV